MEIKFLLSLTKCCQGFHDIQKLKYKEPIKILYLVSTTLQLLVSEDHAIYFFKISESKTILYADKMV